jgi:NADPH-dependent 2,4-dienoyl-CoA reductase/sulfur reductase-like enzyme
MKVLIVGAGVAGVSTATALRGKGFTGEIVLVSEESELPYDRPPLSKQYLSGAWPSARLRLRTAEFYRTNDIRLRLRSAATGVDPQRRLVHFAAGSENYDALVIATGLSARRLPGQDDIAGLHSLRTFDDARHLRRALSTTESLVVVGGGFIGLEVAATAAGRGIAVTVVEPLTAPLAGALGAEVGTRVRRLHEEHGVTVITGVGVRAALGERHLDGVELTDGSRIPARQAVVGIGSRPNTDWLMDGGLPVDDGVLCDEHCRVLGVDSVYAAGDIVRRTGPHGRILGRVEHWTNAVEHADVVAAALLGSSQQHPVHPVPYFWSDQFGVKLQFVGSAVGARPMTTVDRSRGKRGSLTVFGTAAEATGALAWDWPTAAGHARKLLRGPATVEAIVAKVAEPAGTASTPQG